MSHPTQDREVLQRVGKTHLGEVFSVESVFLGTKLFDWALGRYYQYFLDWIGQDFEGITGSDAYEVYPKYCRLQKPQGR